MSFLKLQTPQDLAEFLGIELKHLMYLAYSMPSNIKYKSFKIFTKKKERLISSPFFTLKKIQYQLKEEFEKIYKPRKSAHGFIKNKSVKENASNHLNKRYVFNIDLQNFFGSITSIRIKYLLICQPFNLPYPVADIISKLVCHDGVLPQGSPCSPVLSNMISHRMDGELSYLAKNNNATYTRYVDDITFSFTKRFKALPKEIISFENGDLNVGEKLNDIITSNGFAVNQSKVRLGKKSNRMEVTGITVNEKLNVPREYIRKIRTLLHLVDKYGEDKANEVFAKFKRTRASKYPPKIENSLHGMLTYLSQIVGLNNMVYYKLAKKYNNFNFKSKLSIVKPLELQIEDALWVVELPTCEEGTAFSISPRLIVTAAHVVIDEDTGEPHKDEIIIYKSFNQDNEYHLKVHNYNIQADVALCEIIEDFEDDSYFELGEVVGKKLKLLGFPQYQKNQLKPHISDCDLMFDTEILDHQFFSINTPIIAGNSGGPIIDINSRVVGVASKGYYGQGVIDIGSLSNKSINVTILGNNLCSNINNVKNLMEK